MNSHGLRYRLALAGVAVAAVLATTACPSSVHQTYKAFQGAVEKGSSCSDLFEMRGRFDKADVLAKVDADLARIGCSSPESVRTDR